MTRTAVWPLWLQQLQLCPHLAVSTIGQRCTAKQACAAFNPSH